jgi:hypothetical protein
MLMVFATELDPAILPRRVSQHKDYELAWQAGSEDHPDRRHTILTNR